MALQVGLEPNYLQLEGLTTQPVCPLQRIPVFRRPGWRLAERERVERSPVVFQTTVRKPCTPPFGSGVEPTSTMDLHHG